MNFLLLGRKKKLYSDGEDVIKNSSLIFSTKNEDWLRKLGSFTDMGHLNNLNLWYKFCQQLQELILI